MQYMGGEQWKANVVLTATVFPGLVFAVEFIMNLVCCGVVSERRT